MEAATTTVLNDPLYLNPSPSTRSGVTVKNAPNANATGNKNTDDGHAARSKLPPSNTLRSPH